MGVGCLIHGGKESEGGNGKAGPLLFLRRAKEGVGLKASVDPAGGDLRDALGDDHKGEFGWYGKGARIMVDIASGLHFLHSNNVIHR